MIMIFLIHTKLTGYMGAIDDVFLESPLLFLTYFSVLLLIRDFCIYRIFRQKWKFTITRFITHLFLFMTFFSFATYKGFLFLSYFQTGWPWCLASSCLWAISPWSCSWPRPRGGWLTRSVPASWRLPCMSWLQRRKCAAPALSSSSVSI